MTTTTMEGARMSKYDRSAPNCIWLYPYQAIDAEAPAPNSDRMVEYVRRDYARCRMIGMVISATDGNEHQAQILESITDMLIDDGWR